MRLLRESEVAVADMKNRSKFLYVHHLDSILI